MLPWGDDPNNGFEGDNTVSELARLGDQNDASQYSRDEDV